MVRWRISKFGNSTITMGVLDASVVVNLALTIEHKVPDCLYLALAEREGAFIASADRKLLGAAKKRGIDIVTIPPA